MGVIAWWAGLDWKLRIGIGLLFLGIVTVAISVAIITIVAAQTSHHGC